MSRPRYATLDSEYQQSDDLTELLLHERADPNNLKPDSFWTLWARWRATYDVRAYDCNVIAGIVEYVLWHAAFFVVALVAMLCSIGLWVGLWGLFTESGLALYNCDELVSQRNGVEYCEDTGLTIKVLTVIVGVSLLLGSATILEVASVDASEPVFVALSSFWQTKEENGKVSWYSFSWILLHGMLSYAGQILAACGIYGILDEIELPNMFVRDSLYLVLGYFGYTGLVVFFEYYRIGRMTDRLELVNTCECCEALDELLDPEEPSHHHHHHDSQPANYGTLSSIVPVPRIRVGSNEEIQSQGSRISRNSRYSRNSRFSRNSSTYSRTSTLSRRSRRHLMVHRRRLQEGGSHGSKSNHEEDSLYLFSLNTMVGVMGAQPQVAIEPVDVEEDTSVTNEDEESQASDELFEATLPTVSEQHPVLIEDDDQVSATSSSLEREREEEVAVTVHESLKCLLQFALCSSTVLDRRAATYTVLALSSYILQCCVWLAMDNFTQTWLFDDTISPSWLSWGDSKPTWWHQIMYMCFGLFLMMLTRTFYIHAAVDNRQLISHSYSMFFSIDYTRGAGLVVAFVVELLGLAGYFTLLCGFWYLIDESLGDIFDSMLISTRRDVVLISLVLPLMSTGVFVTEAGINTSCPYGALGWLVARDEAAEAEKEVEDEEDEEEEEEVSEA